jgi:DNA polymerase-3 subunit gamma/tau
MDAASNRGIEDIRVLRERIGLAPVRGKYTIYIIDEVHMLTAEAFNALLKTLEEPPGHAVFVLATTDPQKVPATIRSRCVEIPFRKAGDEEIAHAIGRIVKKEKMNIKSDAIAAIIDAADGAFRDAVKMLEQASFIKGEITKERIRTMLSISDEVRRAKFLHTLFTKKDPGVCIAEIQSLSQAGIDAKQFLTDCISDLEETLVRKVKGTENSDERMWVDVDVRDFSRRLIEAYGLLKICPVSELPIELAVIDFCQGRSIQPTSDTKKAPAQPSSGLLTLEKLTSHWPDFIDELKSHNHSVAGVLRSAKPKSVEHGVVTIEAFYKFHQERLSEARVRDILSEVLKKLFGEKVKVEIVLGKK